MHFPVPGIDARHAAPAEDGLETIPVGTRLGPIKMLKRVRIGLADDIDEDSLWCDLLTDKFDTLQAQVPAYKASVGAGWLSLLGKPLA